MKQYEIGDKCPKCIENKRRGGFLIEKHGKYGKFLACTNYPQCYFALSEKHIDKRKEILEHKADLLLRKAGVISKKKFTKRKEKRRARGIFV